MASKKYQLSLIGERPLYFYQTYYGTIGWRHNRFPTNLLWISRGSITQFFYNEEEQAIHLGLWKYALSRPQFLKAVAKNFKKIEAEFVKEFQNQDWKVTTIAELLTGHQKLVQFYQTYQGDGNAYARLIDHYGLRLLRQELTQLGVADVETAITTLTASAEESYLAKEERIFWQGILRIKSAKAQAIFLQKHLVKFAWVGRSYMEEPALTREDLAVRLQKVPPSKRKYKLAHLAETLKRNRRERKALIKKYRLSKDVQRHAQILRESAALKDFIRGVLGKIYFLCDPIYDELEKRTKVSRADIKNMTLEEFREVLGGAKMNRKLLHQRLGGPYLVDGKGRRPKVLYGRAVEKFEKRYLNSRRKTKQRELTGRPASVGQAQGKVRVIHTWTEMKDFKTGEILVANNTNPAFVPYLHKAAAIIAAEGGVTVHAAIVSRELKIPCIVGVHDVTRILKTGEVVFVDAAKGLITRL